jgi:hypothetical protein
LLAELDDDSPCAALVQNRCGPLGFGRAGHRDAGQRFGFRLIGAEQIHREEKLGGQRGSWCRRGIEDG